MGCEFEVHAAHIDETRLVNENAFDYVARVANEKANSIYQNLDREPVAVIGADTIVTVDGDVFGKPKDEVDALRMWNVLSDCTHQVTTAVCLVSAGRSHSVLVTTEVEFGAISKNQMRQYWSSGEPQDKAGGYAIQGLASAWVKLIHGSYSNVVGLPLRETNQLLKIVGHHWL
jgi:septum formation protein